MLHAGCFSHGLSVVAKVMFVCLLSCLTTYISASAGASDRAGRQRQECDDQLPAGAAAVRNFRHLRLHQEGAHPAA